MLWALSVLKHFPGLSTVLKARGVLSLAPSKLLVLIPLEYMTLSDDPYCAEVYNPLDGNSDTHIQN